jgi:thymidine phosphorylase
VAAGDTLFTLYTDTPERFPSALAELNPGFKVGDFPPAERPLIIDRITP